MILNLKTPVYDNHTGNVIVGEEATYDEVCAFAGKFVKQRCLMLTPIGNQTTLLYFQNFSLYYNSEDKTLEKTLRFIPIEQEYFLILRKALPYMLDYAYTAHAQLDIRDAKCTIWKDVVHAAMYKLGGQE